MASTPAPVTFTDLPIEIQEKIIGHLSWAIHTLRRLRLTSKHLEALATPVLLQEMTISTLGRPKLHRCQDFLEALASGRASVFGGVRKLTLTTGLFEGFEHARPYFTLLNALLPELKNLHTISWKHYLDNRYPSQTIEKLFQAVIPLQKLRKLGVLLVQSSRNSGTRFPIDIAHLQTLTLKWDSYSHRPTADILQSLAGALAGSTALEYFTFICPKRFDDGGMAVALSEIFGDETRFLKPLELKTLRTTSVVIRGDEFRKYLPHFRHLRALEILDDPSPLSQNYMGEICQALGAAGVSLKEIKIDAFKDPAVFTYLSSFSGLEQIFLMGYKLSQGVSSSLVDEFFSSVLGPHSDSLKRLRLGGDRVTEWSLPLEKRYMHTIAQCQRLEYICCWIVIRPEDVVENNANALLCWLEACLQLPRLRQLKCPLVSAKRFDTTMDAEEAGFRTQLFASEVLRNFKKEYSVHFEVGVDFETFSD